MTVWQRWGDVWTATALLAPLAVLVTVGLTRWRLTRAVPRERAWRWSVAEVGMVAGTLPWAWMVLTPVAVPPGTVMTYLVPLSDIHAQLSQPLRFIVIQFAGNLLVLAALGAGAPARFVALAGPLRLLALGAGCSLLLELAQRVLVTGRVFSVDDILLNAIGCLLGGLVTYRWWARPRVGALV